MYRLYEYPASGNCYKLRLLMSYLDIDYERVSIDITRGESRTPDFLEINPNGRVPVLQTPADGLIPESNAALWYLAFQTPFRPSSKIGQAQVLQWMFFEQYSHEPFIATSRYWISVLQATDEYKTQLAEKQPKGYAALDVMEAHLGRHPFFVDGIYTIADIALYAYTHVAHEGGFSLRSYPAIEDWIRRIEQTRNHVTIGQ